MPAIPDVVTGTAIATTWGDAVKDQLNTSCIRVVRITSTQSIADVTDVTVVLNSIVREDDEGASLSHATGTGILTIAHAGWYLFTAGVLWDTNATGFRSLSLAASGAKFATVRGPASAGTQVTLQTVAALHYITAGQTITVIVHQNSGAARTISNDNQTFLSAFRIRLI